jgi:hypothetical protein
MSRSAATRRHHVAGDTDGMILDLKFVNQKQERFSAGIERSACCSLQHHNFSQDGALTK